VRPPEVQDGLNRFIFHPLAHRLARALHPTGISPNLVSVAGTLLVWGAAFAYTGMDWPASAILGFTLHALWHVVDGADGDLARLTGKSSPTGELVDGVCDYSGHLILYILLTAQLDDRLGAWAWVLAVAASASHIVQNNHAETQRRTYLWWAYGVPWLKHAQTAGDEVFQGRNWFSLTFGWMAREYIRLSQSMTPNAQRVDLALAASAGDPQESERIRRLVKEECAKSLELQKLLGSNPRTIILGLSMAFGSPIWFFLAQFVAMNLLLAYSVRHHNAANARLVRRL
jgi:phosphatidylglycerophosphate synthase